MKFSISPHTCALVSRLRPLARQAVAEHLERVAHTDRVLPAVGQELKHRLQLLVEVPSQYLAVRRGVLAHDLLEGDQHRKTPRVGASDRVGRILKAPTATMAGCMSLAWEGGVGLRRKSSGQPRRAFRRVQACLPARSSSRPSRPRDRRRDTGGRRVGPAWDRAAASSRAAAESPTPPSALGLARSPDHRMAWRGGG